MSASPVLPGRFGLSDPILDTLGTQTPPAAGRDFAMSLADAAGAADVFEFSIPGEIEDFVTARTDGPEAGDADAGGAVAIETGLAAAKGGNGGGGGGKPDKGGNDGGGPDAGDTTLLVGTYTSGADDAVTGTDNFNVTLNFYGEAWTSDMMNAMAAAADFLSALIVSGLPQDSYNGQAIDDVSIDLTMTNIDGQLGVAAQGRPLSVRSSDGATPDGLTVTGEIQFDLADMQLFLDNGTLDDLGLHEMMHILGFGTLWEVPGVRDWVDSSTVPNTATKNPWDTILINEYSSPRTLDTGDRPLVETEGGQGSLGHWSEAVYGDELMTSVINVNGNFLSDMTLLALEDLGYAIDWSVGGTLATTVALNADYVADDFLV